METVTSADGTSIAFERHGEGRPLICVHGGSRPDYWRPVVPQFTEQFEVIVPHRRGHGESDGVGDDLDGEGSDESETDSHGLDSEVSDLRAVVEAVGGDPVLFGHSFGGLVALETARTTSVEAVVAYEPAVLVGEYREEANLAATMQSLLDDGDRRGAMRTYVAEVMHGGDTEGLDEWLDEWPPWPDIVGLAENVTRINRVIETYRLPERLDTDAPTLLLTGTEGPPHLRDGVRAVHEAVPDSRLVEFDGVGHGGPTEAPERVERELLSLLDE
jgi:pimeloyl-ACP methyl ester carboxylesterase